MDIKLTQKGFDEFARALKRNPRMVITETGKYLKRGIVEYRRVIQRSPWRVGGAGGGAPKNTGNLRDTHRERYGTFEASIGPDLGRTRAKQPWGSYAFLVHDGTSRVDARPWLDYAKDKSTGKIRRLQEDLLKNIVKDLAR